MLITKKQTLVIVLVVLFSLTTIINSPLSKAQEAVDNTAADQESINLIQKLAGTAATKLRMSIEHSEQILGRLNSRYEKMAASQDSSPDDISGLTSEAENLLAEAEQTLENIEDDVQAILESGNPPQEQWGGIAVRFDDSRRNISSALQNIFEAVTILLNNPAGTPPPPGEGVSPEVTPEAPPPPPPELTPDEN